MKTRTYGRDATVLVPNATAVRLLWRMGEVAGWTKSGGTYDRADATQYLKINGFVECQYDPLHRGDPHDCGEGMLEVRMLDCTWGLEVEVQSLEPVTCKARPDTRTAFYVDAETSEVRWRSGATDLWTLLEQLMLQGQFHSRVPSWWHEDDGAGQENA